MKTRRDLCGLLTQLELLERKRFELDLYKLEEAVKEENKMNDEIDEDIFAHLG